MFFKAAQVNHIKRRRKKFAVRTLHSSSRCATKGVQNSEIFIQKRDKNLLMTVSWKWN